MSATIHDLLRKLWEDYTRLNPHAEKVHQLLIDRGEQVHNDHIAFRTWDHPRVSVDALAEAFVSFGYQPADTYDFPEKKLFARHYDPPEADLPKVFISHLRTGEFSDALQQMVQRFVEQVPEAAASQWNFPIAGRPWAVSYEEYEQLRRESEYAAWLAAHGFRANHFTVSVNALQSFDSLAQLNTFLKDQGFTLNDAGGEIKGSPEAFLEQSSTVAEEVEVPFSDGPRRVPGCYYEFARRYPLPDGRLFGGFVAKSADKIFQSTDRR